jgi:hypothetical protein
MKHLTYLFLLSLVSISCTHTPAKPDKKLIIVTIDGMRWQEIFFGMDQKLLNDEKYTHEGEELTKSYPDREKLLPFIWNTVAKKGQIYGNRNLGSEVDVTNTTLLSYAGYNELFTGHPDPKIIDNTEIDNPNENVFEFLDKQEGYQGKVAVFATWHKFHGILNIKRNKFVVNTTGDAFNFEGAEFKLLNDLQNLSTKPIGFRPDIFTYGAAREYLKKYKPKVLYIAFDETDDMAHYGWYDQYIKSAHSTDAMIADLWNTIQSLDEYKDQTTLVITSDHGRGGIGKATWMHHGYTEDKAHVHIPESNQIWMAFMGPGIEASGEMKNAPKLYQRQIATTLADILGFEFRPKHEVMSPISFRKEK